MKILFLDIDGVMNSHASALNSGGDLTKFAPEAVSTLNAVLQETGACVVISSSWRCSRTMEEMCILLEEQGVVCSVVGMTPDLSGYDSATKIYTAPPRGLEIAMWLHETEESIEGICIVDDGDDMEDLKHKLVQTTWEHGLTTEHKQELIDKLLQPYV